MALALFRTLGIFSVISILALFLLWVTSSGLLSEGSVLWRLGVYDISTPSEGHYSLVYMEVDSGGPMKGTRWTFGGWHGVGT